jgi:hypothetical protein
MSDPLASLAKPRSGARTPEGLERCRRATWKHGGRSAEIIAGQRLRGEARRVMVELRASIQIAEAELRKLGAG